MDIKGSNLIKGIHLEGLRIVGDPQQYASQYYEEGIDELVFMDIVASLYGRNNLHEIVKYTANNIFVPLTVGGGVRSVDHAQLLLHSGADKIAVNTAAVNDPQLISKLANRFGSQCVVLSIEAKKKTKNSWEAYTDNGRESTNVDVLEWAKKAESLGAGEILLTSVDREGTRKGFDVDLVKLVSSEVSIPVIASGGFGKPEHFVEVVKSGCADAVAVADALHYNRFPVQEIRDYVLDAGISVRSV